MQDLSELLALHMRTRHVRVSLTLEKQISEDSQYSNVRKFTGKRRSEPLTMAESTFLGLLATEGFEEFYREGQFSVLGATIERADDGSTSFSVTFAKDETKFEPAAFVEDMNVFRRDKGVKGTVLSRVDDRHVIVEGVNVVKKTVRPNPMAGIEGGIVDKTLPIDQSNLMLVNPETGKGDRVGFKEVDGKKVRVFKSNGAVVGAKAE